MESESRKPGKKEVNRQIVIRALTDPDFRAMLQESPQKALGISRLTDKNRDEIRFVLAAVKAIEFQIASLADELLCANGGPCGIG